MNWRCQYEPICRYEHLPVILDQLFENLVANFSWHSFEAGWWSALKLVESYMMRRYGLLLVVTERSLGSRHRNGGSSCY
jgi:hypothetical protein